MPSSCDQCSNIANCGEIVIYETLLQALNAPTDGSIDGTDSYRASQQRYKKGGMLRDSVGYIVHPVNTYIYMYGRELDLVIPSLQI